MTLAENISIVIGVVVDSMQQFGALVMTEPYVYVIGAAVAVLGYKIAMKILNRLKKG